MKYRYYLVLFFAFLLTSSSFAQIRINEIMASNSTTVTDDQGDFDDWVEILNMGSVSIDIGGIYVSDDPENPTKWQIPGNESASTTIAPGEFKLLWFDDDADDGALHFPMKLSALGESVILTESDGSTLVDRVDFNEQETDISFGATVDGGDTFDFQTPTPEASNSGEIVKIPAEAPTFTLETGFYTGTQVVGISTTSSETEIRYTIDSSIPTKNSLLYENPLSIDSSVVIRTIAIAEDIGQYSDSPVSTNTYLFEETHIYPVVSFVMDPDSLFGEEAGLYAFGDSAETDFPFRGANFWKEYEYPMHLEYIEDGEVEFEMDAGASIGGNFSKGFNKKSFILNNNEEYGIKSLDYELFPENDYEKYDGFGLRAGAEERSRLLNELMYGINQKWNHNNDMQANRPVILYLNGQYWGVYTLIERKNDDFVDSRYGYKDIDMISDYDEAKDGDFAAYYDMVDEIVDLDASTSEFYDFIEANINLDSFTDHWIYQVYTSHGDPNNLRYWRPKTEDGKWSYISHDFDWWENLGREPFEYAEKFKFFLETGPYDFWILGKMMENPTYQKFFLTRMADMLNTAFKKENIFAMINSIDTAIDPEMSRDIARWTENWRDISGFINYDMEYIREITEDYAEDYPSFIYQEVLDTLDVDTVRITIEQLAGGSVKLNSINPNTDNSSWSGLYFEGNTIELQAQSYAGSLFTGWLVDGESAGTTNTLSIDLASDPVLIEAQFVSNDELIVINEINYNSEEDKDSGDWVEIYNPGSSEIDLSNWVYKDEDDANEFLIPSGTILGVGEYLVLSHDLIAFDNIHPLVDNVLGVVEFGLSGNNDQVRIFNASGDLIDLVSYDDEAPWSTDADGLGYTLELKNTTLDNSKAENWTTSLSKKGTPGVQNQIIINSIEDSEATPKEFVLSQNYPNPFNPSTNISFSVPSSGKVELSIFNVLGQKVHTLVDGNLSAGNHTYTFDASGLTSGVYFYRIVARTNTATQKMLLMK